MDFSDMYGITSDVNACVAPKGGDPLFGTMMPRASASARLGDAGGPFDPLGMDMTGVDPLFASGDQVLPTSLPVAEGTDVFDTASTPPAPSTQTTAPAPAPKATRRSTRRRSTRRRKPTARASGTATDSSEEAEAEAVAKAVSSLPRTETIEEMIKEGASAIPMAVVPDEAIVAVEPVCMGKVKRSMKRKEKNRILAREARAKRKRELENLQNNYRTAKEDLAAANERIADLEQQRADLAKQVAYLQSVVHHSSAIADLLVDVAPRLRKRRRNESVVPEPDTTTAAPAAVCLTLATDGAMSLEPCRHCAENLAAHPPAGSAHPATNKRARHLG